MRNRISTKKGDKGMTRTLKGGKVSKNSKEIEFIGTLDELQSFLGLIEDSYEVEEIQYDLYKIMAGEKVEVERIEGYINELSIPDINHFIIPRGIIHVARSVCRRAERRAVEVSSKNVDYLNRLSDYLYILSFNK